MHSDSIGAMSKKLGIPYALLAADYDEYKKPLMEGFMSTDDYYEHLRLHFDVNVEGDMFYTGFEPFHINGIMLSLVDAVRRSGVRAVIGSNTFAPHWRYVFSSGLDKHFDACYASHLMHITKPDPEFWSYILSHEGYTPEEALFIDDREENILGAASLGIEAFHYRSDEELIERFKAFLT